MGKLKSEWASNVRGDILSAMVVAIALIPEAISFSIIAGVDPMVGIYTSVCVTIITAIAGGRPGMISASTGAMALVMVPLVREYGYEYLLATTILAGVMQLTLGWFKVAKLMKYIPRAVMMGFLDALAISIFLVQMRYTIGISSMTYVVVIGTLSILYWVPKFIKSIPAPLIAIVLMTGLSVIFNFDVQRVGDLGTITRSLPSFIIPNVPFNFETLRIIAPYAFSLTTVGLIDSLLTASVVDDISKTKSDKTKEACGLGIANILAGFFGGMAGCGVIGQSIMNIKTGGKSRLSTLCAGIFLMFLILVLGDFVLQVPMPVLVGIMIMVTIRTFDWASFSYLVKAPKGDVMAMLTTIIVVVASNDLSKGVFAGVLVSFSVFIFKTSRIHVSKLEEGNKYHVVGQLFFASTQGFIDSFDFNLMGETIILDFAGAHVWDDSAVGAIDRVVMQYRENNNVVHIQNLNVSSQKIVDKLAVH